jgi:quercetin dioxygenase-like cupin family protein
MYRMTEDTTPKGVPFSAAGHVAYIEGAVVSKILLKKDTGNVTLFAFEAGQGLSEHTAPFDALVEILDGEARITIGGEAQRVKAGEMIVMPANVPHALQAERAFKMLLVMIRG